jgi:pimeloyl-ACP methyl ester carboxylesterase
MHTFTSFDGTRIAYSDEGDGPAVILLHGFGVDALGQFGEFEIAEATDPKFVHFVLDTGHITMAGMDPVELAHTLGHAGCEDAPRSLPPFTQRYFFDSYELIAC